MTQLRLEFPRTNAVWRSLDNGLEVVVKEDHSAPVISAQAWVRTGSCFEDKWLGSGVSHLVEHMVFKGSSSRGPADMAREVQAVGGYLNAYTSFDRTVYYIDAPTDGIETALDVLADLVLDAAFAPDEFEREKDVIRREIDMGDDDPDTKNSHLLFETVFRVHPMGQPIIGHLPLFNRLTREDALDYYRRRYVPNNVFLVVAGPVDADRIQALVQPLFGARPRAPLRPAAFDPEPEQLGRRDNHVEFPTDLTKLNFAWRIPGLTHPDIPALEVLSEVLGQGRSSRLFRRIRESLGLVHSIGASCYAPPLCGIFSIHGDLDAGNRAAVEAEALGAVEEIKRDGVTEAEVQKAQRMILGEQLEGLTTMRGIAGDVGSNWQVARNLDFTRDMVEAIEAVTPAEVQSVARRYLVERGLTVTSLNPRGTLAAHPSSKALSDSGSVEKLVLPNGVTLLTRRDARVPLVTLHATLRGGSLAETPATAGLTRLMVRALLKGTANRSAAEISGVLEDLGGGISSDSGGSSWAVNVDVLQPDIEIGLEVLADVLLNPTFPEAEVEREREAQLAAIRADADRLTNVAFRHLRETLFGPNPFALERNGTGESIQAITSTLLAAVHRQQAAAGNLVLAVFGDVDPAHVRNLVEAKFTPMPPGPRGQTTPGIGFAPDFSTVFHDVIHPKRQAVLAVGFPTVDLFHRDRVALDLLDESCSDMGSRLFLRLREELGLAYYTGAFQILGMAPGAFAFYLGTAPESLETAERELIEQIHRLANHGLDAAEFERVKQSWLGKHLIHQQGPENLARMAALDELYGVGHDYHDKLAGRIRSIPLDEVNAAAARYFGPAARHATIRLHPSA